MSRDKATRHRASPLLSELRWLLRLRWLAGLAVVAGSLTDWFWQRWYDHDLIMAGFGAFILFYNLILSLISPSAPPPSSGATQQPEGCCVPDSAPGLDRPKADSSLTPAKNPSPFFPPVGLAWLQILLDLGVLTLLVIWTGGVASPLLGFFVLHMVFASLLLPRFMAYAGALAAAVMVLAALWWSDLLAANPKETVALAAWVVLLLATVHLSNHITRSLRRHERRLMRQNQRIRAMSRRLAKQQRAMMQQEKMAALGQMAAGVAHEIANPLASMDSLLQLMQRKPAQPRPGAIDTLRQQVDRIREIVQQLTTFARPGETGWQMVDVNELVEESLRLVRFDPRARKVKINRQLSPQAGQLHMQRRAMEQVLVNLLLNAMDAVAENPEPAVAMRTLRQENQCLIEVEDNGHGIAPEHLGRLFDPFFTTKPVGKGTGLGLAVSYSILRQHNGQIEVDSQVNQGACFRLRIPVSTWRFVPIAGTTAR
ncbi:MAG: GHKL domain-containing protein [Phycisphaeraceae bacterium]|nr:GHKL domain-containing protein [Phycisphaeraceae bacterium]